MSNMTVRGHHVNQIFEWNCGYIVWCALLIVLGTFSKTDAATPESLSKMVSQYDRIMLNLSTPSGPQTAHLSAAHLQPIQLQVTAMGRTFDITLRPAVSVFTHDAVVVLHDEQGSQTFPASDFPSNSVEGFVAFEPRSRVLGHLNNGIFDGVITSLGQVYYVEPARRFFGDEAHEAEAVVYRQRDVRSVRGGRLDTRSSLPRLDDDMADGPKCGVRSDAENDIGSSEPAAANHLLGQSSHLSEWLGGEQRFKQERVCRYMVTCDHTFFKTAAASNPKTAMNMVNDFMKNADTIFKETDFDNDRHPDEVRIYVVRTEIYQSERDRRYDLGDPSLNASEYLMRYSRLNFGGYCGALILSNRVFSDDTLGYAFRGGPKAVGGICYKRQLYRGKMHSLNVGMVTFMSSWGALLKSQAVVVLTHEIGHMFGSQHDDDMENGICYEKNDPSKHYLMSAIANAGTTETNRKFSPCSRRRIQENLIVNGGCLMCRGRECNRAGASHLSGNWSTILWLLFAAHLLLPLHHDPLWGPG